eukprot:TRINITY_DN21131_c0_g1_i1.p1 TRINITY_DN21131_c0_g1~~TRINITY_DN21131_c0_g1_i1.p1  ORF type:complete len:402 (+),score=40.62 TRINITY_DN21131_c0_g1_i1:210-1415(+)
MTSPALYVTIQAGRLQDEISTILAVARILGKGCTEEFKSIHGQSAKRQLEDGMIGSLDRNAAPTTSVSAGFAACLIRIMPFLNSAQDVLRLSATSKECSEILLTWMSGPRLKHEAHIWCPLALHSCDPPAKAIDQGIRVVRGVQYQQTAVLLGPRLFGSGRVVPTHVEVILKSYRAPGCVSFGMVPEKEFQRDPQGSRRFAYTFDGLGRLRSPDGDRGDQAAVRLYGERVAEGDHLGLEILECPFESQCRRAQCSFTVNGRNLGAAFVIDADQDYLPVLYFFPMLNTAALEILLPESSCVMDVRREQAPRGLFFNELSPDLTSCLQIAVDEDNWDILSIYDAKARLAQRLSQVGSCAVQASQVSIFIDGAHIDDDNLKLRDRITYQEGIHLQKLHWLTCWD